MLGICCGRRTVHAVEPLPEEIAQHYENEIDEGLRITEGFGQLELVRTQAVMRPYLSGGPLSIIDIGGGTGVHAAWLAEDGHAVHVIDPVPRHVENARDLSNRHRQITAEVGDARQLRADDETFDAAVVLGPLYHLTDREERLKALREARRVVRPGGKLFVAAVSRFASLFYGLAREFSSTRTSAESLTATSQMANTATPNDDRTGSRRHTSTIQTSSDTKQRQPNST